MTQDDNNDDGEIYLDAITGLLQPLLTALEALTFAGRHLHPPQLPQLVEQVAEWEAPVREGLEAFQAVDWPDRVAGFAEQMETAAIAVCRAFEGLRAAVEQPDGIRLASRATRQTGRAVAALYPLAANLPPISRFFLEESARDDEALLQRLEAAERGREGVGVIHAGNDKGSRGGFSMYVPEYYDAEQAHPLIMALHGGTGHGRDFLWAWLAEARTRGAILVSPTSRGDTWSLMGPDVDSEHIEGILAFVGERWNIDPERLLLTGMSDGGTFAYVSGLRAESPFTHLAPISASFHPLLLEMVDRERIRGLPIYLTHGALDWMFAIDIARTAKQALQAAGADLHYREIADLSHTYPRDENPRIMDWFLSAATP